MSRPVVAYRTWDEALAEALQMIRAIPVEHNAHTIRFGTFAESIGGGHYVSITISYSVGNTKEAPPQPAEQVHRTRIARTVEAWRKAAIPEPESLAEAES